MTFHPRFNPEFSGLFSSNLTEAFAPPFFDFSLNVPESWNTNRNNTGACMQKYVIGPWYLKRYKNDKMWCKSIFKLALQMNILQKCRLLPHVLTSKFNETLPQASYSYFWLRHIVRSDSKKKANNVFMVNSSQAQLDPCTCRTLESYSIHCRQTLQIIKSLNFALLRIHILILVDRPLNSAS